MLGYWLSFGFLAWMALTRMRPVNLDSLHQEKWDGAWINVFIFLTLLIGLRHQVGGDWFNYLVHLEILKNEALSAFFKKGDPGYEFLNWVGANIAGGLYLVNTLSALVFVYGLIVFCRNQPRPWLALLVAFPYLIVVVSMGYTRQGVAIGLAMLALNAMMCGRIFHFVLWIICAALFHKTAIVLLPLVILRSSQKFWLSLIGVLILVVFLFVFLLQEAVDSFMTNYVGSGMSSSGAVIRIAMNALPAAVFLIYGKCFMMSEEQKKLWTWLSIIALFFIVLLVISPSSTAVDRVALYLIPLQLFVWSRVPDAFGKPGCNNEPWVYMVVAYSFGVLFVWLFAADHAFAWLPYQFYPWVWLWS